MKRWDGRSSGSEAEVLLSMRAAPHVCIEIAGKLRPTTCLRELLQNAVELPHLIRLRQRIRRCNRSGQQRQVNASKGGSS